jgi:HD superfamily phosphohydrolase YqeK
MTDTEENKFRFITLLKSINRTGIENVINWLECTDFFEAPASTQYHENYIGGLCEHSLKVYDTFLKLKDAFKLDISDESIAVMSLLHDVCKIDCYHKEKKNVKIGQNWTQVDYWKFDDENPIGHGHKSVIILLKEGFSLTDLEINSIIAHMNGYDKSEMFNASNIYNKNELTMWLHVADFIATYKDRKVV